MKNVDLETRLARAARVLDSHIEQPATVQGYLAPATRPSRRRPLVVSMGIFACALAFIVAVISVRTNHSTMVSSAPDGEGWTALADAPIAPRFQHLAVSTGAGLFIWGGYAGQDNKSDGAYLDSTAGEWRKLPDAPLDGERGDAIGVWTGREVVVVNGVGTVRAAAFDPVAFTWRALPDPPLANAANAMNRAFFVDGAVIVIGVATEGDGKAPSQAARHDLVTGQWTTIEIPPLQFGSFFQATAAGEEIVIVGLRPNMKDECGSIILAYRPSTNTWREIPGGTAANRFGPMVVWTGSELFVGGGRVCAQFDVPSATAELLDLASGQWRHAPDAPIGFESSMRYADLWTGKSVATITPDGTPLLFNPATNAWHVGGASRAESTTDDTPFVWLDGSIVIWSGGAIDGPMCCIPVDGGVAYTPPPGW